ncbi:MAG: rhodanese-like domain-containing protein [Treponema sp.]|nr:rhodanese-like domain-containing protein [Treponema sp.]
MTTKLLYIVAGIIAVLLLFGRRKSGAEKITPQAVKAKIDAHETYLLLDVRTPQEYATGHIPTAILLPDYEVKKNAPVRIPEKDRYIIVYCRSGARSAKAARILISLGYTNVHDMGGIMHWPFDIEQ